MSSILDRMQKNGLIDRAIDSENRRTIRVSPTKRGLELQAPVEAIIEEMNQRVLAPFSVEEQEALRRALIVIADLELK